MRKRADAAVGAGAVVAEAGDGGYGEIESQGGLVEGWRAQESPAGAGAGGVEGERRPHERRGVSSGEGCGRSAAAGDAAACSGGEAAGDGNESAEFYVQHAAATRLGFGGGRVKGGVVDGAPERGGDRQGGG